MQGNWASEITCENLCTVHSQHTGVAHMLTSMQLATNTVDRALTAFRFIRLSSLGCQTILTGVHAILER